MEMNKESMAVSWVNIRVQQARSVPKETEGIMGLLQGVETPCRRRILGPWAEDGSSRLGYLEPLHLVSALRDLTDE